MKNYMRYLLMGLLSLFCLTGVQAQDIDSNPSDLTDASGSNWENPPGWRRGPGVSPDRWQNMSAEERQALMEQKRLRNRNFQGMGPRWGRGNHPAGIRRGPGPNWDNPPGWRRGPGTSPDRWRKRWGQHNNPPGWPGRSNLYLNIRR